MPDPAAVTGPVSSAIDRAADQLSRARMRAFGRPMKIGPDAATAVTVTGTVSAVTREDQQLIRGGLVEPIQAMARYRRADGPAPRSGWFVHWGGQWYRIAQVWDHQIDPEWKLGLVELTRGAPTLGA